MMGALSVNAAGSPFQRCCFCRWPGCLARIGDLYCFRSFEGLFSFDGIFKVETFDKTFQRWKKKKLPQAHTYASETQHVSWKPFIDL